MSASTFCILEIRFLIESRKRQPWHLTPESFEKQLASFEINPHSSLNANAMPEIPGHRGTPG
jgi:hypothetical protein